MTSKNDLTLLPALPPGWVAVPEEPTQEMIAAGRHEAAFVFDAGSFEIVATSAYRAMLSARPALSTESGWDWLTSPVTVRYVRDYGGCYRDCAANVLEVLHYGLTKGYLVPTPPTETER